MERGLKGRTLMNYLGALKMAHLVRGVSTEDLEDTFVQACIRGAIIKDPLTQREPGAIIDWLKNQNIPYHRNWLHWYAGFQLFFCNALVG